jgi:hypothetical protein
MSKGNYKKVRSSFYYDEPIVEEPFWLFNDAGQVIDSSVQSGWKTISPADKLGAGDPVYISADNTVKKALAPSATQYIIGRVNSEKFSVRNAKRFGTIILDGFIESAVADGTINAGDRVYLTGAVNEKGLIKVSTDSSAAAGQNAVNIAVKSAVNDAELQIIQLGGS